MPLNGRVTDSFNLAQYLHESLAQYNLPCSSDKLKLFPPVFQKLLCCFAYKHQAPLAAIASMFRLSRLQYSL